MKIRSTVEWFVSRLWEAFFILIVVVAVYVALGRQAVNLLSEYRPTVEGYLSEKLKVPVQIDELRGEWTLLSPRVFIKDVAINPQLSELSSGPQVKSIQIEFDVLATLMSRKLQLGKVFIDGLSVGVQRNQDGNLSVVGWPKLSKGVTANDTEVVESSESKQKRINDSIDWLLKQEKIVVTNAHIEYFEDKRNVTVSADELRIGKRGNLYELQVLANVTRETTIRLQMTTKFEGKPSDLANLKGEVYMKVLEGNFAPWLPREKFQGLQLNNMDLGTELWGRFAQGRLLSLSGSVDAKNITALNANDEALTPIDKISTSFSWQRMSAGEFGQSNSNDTSHSLLTNDSWQLAVYRLDVDFANEHWQERKMYLSNISTTSANHQVQNELDIQFSEFSLKPIADIVLSSTLLKPEHREFIGAIAPEGVFNNGRLRVMRLDGQLEQMRLQTAFSRLKLKAHRELPGFDNVSGYIDTTLTEGVVEITALDSLLDLTSIVRAPIQSKSINGRLRWQKNDEGYYVESNVIKALTDDARGEVVMSLQTYQDQSPPVLRLHAGVFDGDGSKVSTYLPAYKMRETLLKWLDDSIIEGHLTQGDILYNGPVKIDPELQTKRTLQMRFQVEKGLVNYMPGWPIISDGVVDVIVRGRNTEVDIMQGKLFEAQISNAFIAIPAVAIDEVPMLHLKGNVNGDLADGLRFLRESPLRQKVGKFITQVSGQGGMHLSLDLAIALGKKAGIKSQPLKTDVLIDVVEGRLRMASVNLNVNNVNGQASYTAEKGLNAKRLRGRLFNRLVLASINTVMKSRQLVRTDVNVDGKVDIETLNKWANQSVLTALEGETDYQSVLSFWANGQNQSNSITVRSNLRGVTVNMPAPLFKEAIYPQPIEYTMTLERSEQTPMLVHLQYGDDFSMALSIDDRGIERGKMNFSSNVAQIPSHPGLLVEGSLAYINIDEWRALWDRLVEYTAMAEQIKPTAQQSVPGRSVMDSFRMADLRVKRLEGFGVELDDVNGQLMYSGDLLLIILHNKLLSAMVRVPRAYLDIENYQQLALSRMLPKEMIEADFIYLHIPVEEESVSSLELAQDVSQTNGNKEEKDKQAINPILFPRFKLRIRDLALGDRSWGEWRTTADLTQTGLFFKGLDAHFNQIHLQGDLRWENKLDGPLTSFKGAAKSNDVAALFESFGYGASMSSHDATLDLDLNWQGDPTQFSINSSKGNMVLKVNNGQLLSVDNTTSSVRVFGLLNFENFGRRLRLDFGDLYKKGLAFDYFGGNFDLDNAIVTTKDWAIRGPSTQIELKGSLNLATQQVNQDVGMTLPLSRNLVVPAALTGGIPLAATVYVVEKAIGDQLDKLTTIRFQMEGDWDDPKMKKVKFFR